jgi:hypothetical protein
MLADLISPWKILFSRQCIIAESNIKLFVHLKLHDEKEIYQNHTINKFHHNRGMILFKKTFNLPYDVWMIRTTKPVILITIASIIYHQYENL